MYLKPHIHPPRHDVVSPHSRNFGSSNIDEIDRLLCALNLQHDCSHIPAMEPFQKPSLSYHRIDSKSPADPMLVPFAPGLHPSIDNNP